MNPKQHKTKRHRRIVSIGLAGTFLLLGDTFLSGGNAPTTRLIVFAVFATTQGAFFVYLRRLKDREMAWRLLTTQGLFWLAFFASAVSRMFVLRIYGGFGMELPIPTQLWIELIGAVYGHGFLTIPILTGLLAAPHVFAKTSRQKRTVFWAEIVIAGAILAYIPFATYAPVFNEGSKLAGDYETEQPCPPGPKPR